MDWWLGFSTRQGLVGYLDVNGMDDSLLTEALFCGI
jgi:hypothetical protein